jgi:hypothetical protein
VLRLGEEIRGVAEVQPALAKFVRSVPTIDPGVASVQIERFAVKASVVTAIVFGLAHVHPLLVLLRFVVRC